MSCKAILKSWPEKLSVVKEKDVAESSKNCRIQNCYKFIYSFAIIKKLYRLDSIYI